MLTPTEIRRMPPDGLRIAWSDGATQSLSGETLRRNCPCATCREERGDGVHSEPLVRKTKPSSLRIVEASIKEACLLEELWAVGHYAIGMRWSDGHDTGIFTYELLRSLSDKGRALEPANASEENGPTNDGGERTTS